jgi:ATP-dependent Clp protease ATP-binding subunit ClpC
VFARFTDAARRVVVSAQEEARGFNHHYIGTEHLLLGLLRDDAGAAFRILTALEIPLEGCRSRVGEIIGRGADPPAGHIPFTPRAKKVLELSLREARRLDDRFIGSEHILLGLLREANGVGAQVLTERGIDRAAVEDRLSQVEREPAPQVAESAADPEAVSEAEMIHIPGEHFARLVAEVARLRDLLRHHGIDPDEQLPPEPGIGDNGGPPVA